MARSIIWFKTDLRLQDNETLVKAIENSLEVIPVYCFDEAHYQSSEFGFKKTGSFRAQFLLESLADLDANLRKMGSGLIVLRGKPEEEIFKIARDYQVNKVFAKKEVSYEEKQTEEKVEKALWKLNCSLETYSTSTLYRAEDLPFTIKNIPEVFTDFRKKTEKESTVRKVFAKPLKIDSPNIPALSLPSLADLGIEPIKLDPRTVVNFKGGESEAWKRVDFYFYQTKALSTYKETRNGLIGTIYSSKFSPFLALGCISARSIYHEIKNYEKQFIANDSTYWLVFELLWRDYFRFMMKKHRNEFFQQTGIKTSPRSINVHNEEVFKKWVDGQTGIEFIDANMMELKLSGFMSNRGRQNVASYLCNDLKLDWRYGAAYFEQQLIDYDECSNWGNWAYLAGVGNDPRPNRYFNIEKQATDYDVNKLYRKLWLQKI